MDHHNSLLFEVENVNKNNITNQMKKNHAANMTKMGNVIKLEIEQTLDKIENRQRKHDSKYKKIRRGVSP